jgi:hypothetical protein
MVEPVTMGLVEEEREEVEGEEITVCSLPFRVRKDNVYAFLFSYRGSVMHLSQ